MAVGPQDTVLIPWGARILSVGVVAVCVSVEVALVLWGHLEVLLRASPAVALVAVGVVVLFWGPRVAMTPAEVEIVNPLRTYRISWPAIREIGSRWSLTVDTVRGRVTAWAAPAPGPLSEVAAHRRDPFGRLERAPRGSRRRTPTAADLVESQWEAYRDTGMLGVVEGDGVSVRWHTVSIVVLSALIALSVLGAAWP